MERYIAATEELREILPQQHPDNSHAEGLRYTRYTPTALQLYE